MFLVYITSIDVFGKVLRDTSSSSPSQGFISKDGVINNRARVLGGGTCINAGFYTRADSDFLKEAGLDGDENLLNESYQWVEKKLVFKPVLKKWQPVVRDGLLEVGVLPDNGFTYDHLYGTKVNGVIYDKDRNRHTAAHLLEWGGEKWGRNHSEMGKKGCNVNKEHRSLWLHCIEDKSQP